MMGGSLKGKTMAKGLLTEIDKQWITNLITISIAMQLNNFKLIFKF